MYIFLIIWRWLEYAMKIVSFNEFNEFNVFYNMVL